MWTNGKHSYRGKRNSRGKRLMSKLSKGFNTGDIQKAFKEMEALYVSK